MLPDETWIMLRRRCETRGGGGGHSWGRGVCAAMRHARCLARAGRGTLDFTA